MSILLFLLSCVDAYCLDATIPLHQHLPRSRPPPRLITKAVQPQRAISIPMKTKNLRLRCLLYSAPTEEPNTPDSSEPSASPAQPEQEYTDLSFLSEEQRQLYTNAYDASFGLYGEGANLMDKWGYKVVTDGSDSVPFIEDHYTLYNVSFDEFSERIHSIFTDNCLTSTDYAIKFKNYNGRVAVHFSLHNEMVAGMTIYVQEQYPDTYRLVKNTSEEVEFTLISHYDRDGSVENPLEVYIIEYPIRMVKTDYGWRIDDFHTSRYG